MQRRDFLCGVLPAPVLLWVGRGTWIPYHGRLRPGDFFRLPGDLHAQVCLSHGYHRVLGVCLVNSAPWAQLARQLLRGRGWAVPSTTARGVLDVTSTVSGWPWPTRRVAAEHVVWSDVPYAVSVSARGN